MKVKIHVELQVTLRKTFEIEHDPVAVRKRVDGEYNIAGSIMNVDPVTMEVTSVVEKFQDPRWLTPAEADEIDDKISNVLPGFEGWDDWDVDGEDYRIVE